MNKTNTNSRLYKINKRYAFTGGQLLKDGIQPKLHLTNLNYNLLKEAEVLDLCIKVLVYPVLYKDMFGELHDKFLNLFLLYSCVKFVSSFVNSFLVHREQYFICLHLMLTITSSIDKAWLKKQ